MSELAQPDIQSRRAPPAKRAMRAVWRFLPRCKLSYDAGKLITRSVLRPEKQPLRVAISFGGRIPMRLDLASFVANDLYCFDDHYESVTLRLWRRLARDARVILDIGSHIGTFALVAADTNPNARVIAVEADPANFAQLRAHSVAYPGVVAVHAAVADRAGQMWFCSGGENDGAGRLCTEQQATGNCVPIQTCTLTELCRQQHLVEVDLIKLDVEGFEHKLLVADSEFWEEFAPAHVIVELARDKAMPEQAGEVVRAMQRRGYTACRIQGLYAIPFGKPIDLANWHFFR